MKKELTIAAGVLAVVFLCVGMPYWDNAAYDAAYHFAASIHKGTVIPLEANYVGGASGTQDIDLTVEYAEAVGHRVDLYGTLKFEPLQENCIPSAVTKMTQSEVDISWQCGNTLIPQDSIDLHLKDKPRLSGYLWFYDIVPTGIDKP